MSRQSRFLSMVLRHNPKKAWVTLDEAGWVDIGILLSGLTKAGQRISRGDLDAIVAADEKSRYTISPDGKRIRAAQGHSVPVDLGLAPAEPPQILYHGTARRTLDSIFTHGLVPGKRRHVHLSLDTEGAEKVGRRHGEPVVLRVEAAAMREAGHSFWQADNGVWLTDAVPVPFLSAMHEDGAK